MYERCTSRIFRRNCCFQQDTIDFSRNLGGPQEESYCWQRSVHIQRGLPREQELRGQGLARGIVEQAKARAQEFFEEFGPRYDRGPDKSYRYTLESVVATGNQASNRIASTLLHSGEPISTGIELRSGEPSNVYRLTL